MVESERREKKTLDGLEDHGRKAGAKRTARSPHSAVMDRDGSAQMDHRTDRWLDGRQ